MRTIKIHKNVEKKIRIFEQNHKKTEQKMYMYKKIQ